MIVLAPDAMAFAISPEYRMPPSATAGMPLAASAWQTSIIAVICGMPTPATTLVVHIEPGPIPTLTASAPASANAIAASAVAMLPAINCKSGYFFLVNSTLSMTLLLWPCEVSITITSAPAW